MDWKECINKRIVRSAETADELIKSLIETSKNTLLSADFLFLNETTSVSKLSLCYDSLRELLEALALKKGYKIYNHECYTGFLKDIIGDSELSERFNRIRLLRNSVNYYGQKVDLRDAKDKIEELKSLILEIGELID